VKSREEKVSLDGGSLWTQGGTLTLDSEDGATSL
jgi:hypothetical protein